MKMEDKNKKSFEGFILALIMCSVLFSLPFIPIFIHIVFPAIPTILILGSVMGALCFDLLFIGLLGVWVYG